MPGFWLISDPHRLPPEDLGKTAYCALRWIHHRHPRPLEPNLLSSCPRVRRIRIRLSCTFTFWTLVILNCVPCAAEPLTVTDEEVRTYNARYGTPSPTIGDACVSSAPCQRPEDARVSAVDRLPVTLNKDKVKYLKRALRLHSVLPEGITVSEDRKSAEVTPVAALTLEERIKNEGPRVKVLARRLQADAELVKKIDTPGLGTFYDRAVLWVENNFSVRESLEAIKGDDKSPALFSWSKSKGEKAFYTVDGAVDFHPERLHFHWKDADMSGTWGYDSQTKLLFEAHTSTEVVASTNSIYYALPIDTMGEWVPPEKDFGGVTPFVSRWHLVVAPEYITDRAKAVRLQAVDVSLTPTIRRLNLNLEEGDFGAKDSSGITESPTFGISPTCWCGDFKAR